MSQYIEDYVDVTNGKLWYRIYGHKSEKPPVVILHGGPGATHDYLLPLKDLSKDRQIIFYDQLGSGYSKVDFNEDLFCIKNFVDDLRDLLKHLEIKTVILLGQSWGSALALEFFDKYLNVNIEKIIFSAPYFSSDIWAQDAKRLINGLPDEIKNTIIECDKKNDFNNEEYLKAINFYYERHLCRVDPFPEDLLNTFKKMNENIYNYMWGPSEVSIKGTLKDYNAIEKLKHLNIPVLLTCGEFDEARPSSVKYFASEITNSRVRIFKDASHEHHLEKTEAYLGIINDFLNN